MTSFYKWAGVWCLRGGLGFSRGGEGVLWRFVSLCVLGCWLLVAVELGPGLLGTVVLKLAVFLSVRATFTTYGRSFTTRRGGMTAVDGGEIIGDGGEACHGTSTHGCSRERLGTVVQVLRQGFLSRSGAPTLQGIIKFKVKSGSVSITLH